ncbi:T9SS type A sorting domain-containing protein [Botryobacter ruber]|uniref:T9SS type A sorting domain-containing protein n=1 Tax=Botryobacter ruber TaxID=2171629 RepID=UPI000E0AF008|nr:T9SS type A sorting domain-containing protein [Botryobacter ruber]
MRLNTFTKLFLIVAFAGSQITAFAVRAGNDFNTKPVVGEASVYKGAAAVWKQMQEKQQLLSVSARNARPVFVTIEDEHTCSKLYASAVATSFHVMEAYSFSKVFYGTVAVAGLAQAPETKMLPSVNAYPNPSRGKTRLSLSHFGYDNYKIRVSNTIGKVVQTVDLSGTDVADVELDLSRQPAGVYFYSLIVNDKTVETKRLILQK